MIVVGMLLHEPFYCNCALQMETRQKSIYFLCLLIYELIIGLNEIHLSLLVPLGLYPKQIPMYRIVPGLQH